MTTEVWLRNPADFIREAVEVNHLMFAWDRGYLVKRTLDGQKYLNLQVPEPLQYRMLLIGDETIEVNRQSSVDKPAAVYPTWRYGEDQALLEEIIFQPVGEDASLCEDDEIPREIRPVLGQEHRVVITDLPKASSGIGRRFLRYLIDLQEEVPQCILHLHGLYSYRVNFGLGFRAADIDPRTTAQKGKVYLPMGREVRYEATANNMQWVNLLGFKYADLEIPRQRCMYNIKSALWAAEHWGENVKFKTHAPEHTPDIHSSTAIQPTTNKFRSFHAKKQPGDMFTCDTCSLADECKYYRQGAVCSVPRSDGKKLSDMFRSRDSDQIIDALGSVIAKQADRVETGLEYEDLDGDLSPEVTKMMNSLFANGVKLAKLINPELNKGGQSVMVSVGGNHATGVFNPQQLTARVVAALEEQGVARKDITPELVQSVLDPNSNTEEVIEATVVSEETE